MRLKNLFLLAVLSVLGGIVSCSDSKKIQDQERELEELRQLAEMDKKEMENQYAEFALQYDELKKGVQDDSLIAHLEAEKNRYEKIISELRSKDSKNTAEILRLRKELETVRAVLRTYILQVDSLQRENAALTTERDEARAQVADRDRSISDLSAERSQLTEKVAIASQLDATGISLTPMKKNGKAAKKSKDITLFGISFTISKNVTAKTGNRTVYARLLKPGGGVVGSKGSFNYENKSIEYSASKSIEYTGQEIRTTLYVPVSEFLSPGRYSVHIFCDGQMIGSSAVNIEK